MDMRHIGDKGNSEGNAWMPLIVVAAAAFIICGVGDLLPGMSMGTGIIGVILTLGAVSGLREVIK